MNNETYIEVNRTSQLMNKMRKFSVLIDGVEAGKIKDGGRLRIDLEPGEHEIQVKIGQALRFTLDEGEALKFRCGSPVRGWKMFFGLFYVLADPEKYSFIEQE
ncbi:hypothetical protein DI291_01260 [Bacillus paralicheniformis]|uniref:hypothetical protein n=1 Tax=Bacillus paralicheniformis TaxID=1648923 RepID=UPI00197B6F4B|nr:hypothetical protein [Bacillus paralicheniformis]QSF97050.1 hypothetical protein DI291_01260 [Bacillus paralicheniformis]